MELSKGTDDLIAEIYAMRERHAHRADAAGLEVAEGSPTPLRAQMDASGMTPTVSSFREKN